MFFRSVTIGGGSSAGSRSGSSNTLPGGGGGSCGLPNGDIVCRLPLRTRSPSSASPTPSAPVALLTQRQSEALRRASMDQLRPSPRRRLSLAPEDALLQERNYNPPWLQQQKSLEEETTM